MARTVAQSHPISPIEDVYKRQVQRSGEPGYDNADFWIRGQSSFKGGTNPLVLVDGVPRQMQDIEADELESFTLLKDAAATAVYGAEGANGVILITSKRGN